MYLDTSVDNKINEPEILGGGCMIPRGVQRRRKKLKYFYTSDLA